MNKFTTCWQAPSNIALIKYWGKHDVQLPNNPSLSLTLDKAVTITQLEATPKAGSGAENSEISLEYYFQGEGNPSFSNRVINYFEQLSGELPFLTGYHFTIHSRNTFPHSAGIASSASSMAALALCLAEMEQTVTGMPDGSGNFFRRASQLARLGSGSAARSLFNGWVTWGKSVEIADSANEYGTPLSIKTDPVFQNLGVAIMVVSSKPKPLSSSIGHKLMNRHPYAGGRYLQAAANLAALIEAMKKGDFERFAEITENEALSLHSLLMTSAPNGLLMKPNSLKIIEEVRSFRKDKLIPVCFTLDAGPNVLVIYPQRFRNDVVSFINERLITLCEDGKWIDDMAGSGPKKDLI
jgi:diphosphomevalonate decarboxylase